MELAAKTVGKLALVSGTYAAEYVEFEVKRAFEWLGGDRHEGKRHAAVRNVWIELWIIMLIFFSGVIFIYITMVFNIFLVERPCNVFRYCVKSRFHFVFFFCSWMYLHMYTERTRILNIVQTSMILNIWGILHNLSVCWDCSLKTLH